MKVPSKPANEDERLKTLRQYKILDTPAEQAFDDLVRLASYICGSPIAIVSFVDKERQWFKAKLGLAASETSRDVAFCAHAILKPEELLIVPDAMEDERFAANPLVVHDPKIRFYAGAPLVVDNGLALGTLCVLDHVPRELAPEQVKALGVLRNQVERQLELHRKTIELSEAIAERDDALEEVAESERRYRQIAENSLGYMCTHDLNGKLLWVNPAMLEALGYSLEDVIGQPVPKFLSPSVQPLWPEYLARVRKQGLDTGLMRLVTRDGQERQWVYRNVLQRGPHRSEHVLAHAVDVTDQRVEEEKLRDLSLRDPLTKLFNRAYLEESLERELSRAARHQRPLAVLMADVDHFKAINDAHGHAQGDRVLIEVGRMLEKATRFGDVVCRYGGEEFVVLMPDVSLDVAQARAEQIRTNAENLSLNEGAGKLSAITLSLGVAAFPASGTSGTAIMRAADEALYRAKGAGRNRVMAAPDLPPKAP